MRPSDEELAVGALRATTLADALEAIETQGFVVLEDLNAPAVVEEMLEICEGVLSRKRRPVRALPYELLRRHPYVALTRHPIVNQMIEALSGRVRFRDKIRYIRSCPPGAGLMHVHRDVPCGPEACITVDAFLTPFTADNGATHIWPDSRFTAETTQHEHASVAERAEALPYVSIEGPAGSVAFRDERAWHRAGANRTGQPRVMLTIG